jgi:hypothetical protein
LGGKSPPDQKVVSLADFQKILEKETQKQHMAVSVLHISLERLVERMTAIEGLLTENAARPSTPLGALASSSPSKTAIDPRPLLAAARAAAARASGLSLTRSDRSAVPASA